MIRKSLALLLAGALLVGCAEEEFILPGERLDIRAPLDPADAPELPERTAREVPLSIPAQRANDAWTHRNGSVRHAITHPQLGTSLQLAWSAPIGQGHTRKQRLFATPVVDGGRIFTIDSATTVSAFSTSGALLWRRDLTPPGEEAENSAGGALSVADGTLYASSGFGTLVALDAATGQKRWTQRFDAPVSGTATVEGRIAYVVTRDSVAWALNTENGRVLWTLPGAPSVTGVLGGGSPALTDRLVILPFPSSEVSGALRQSGVRIWGGAVSGSRLGRAYTEFSDVNSDPVVVGQRIFAGNAAGRVAALDAVSGERLWTAREGAFGPVWPVGNAVFLISDVNELVRLNANTGEVVWAVPLPFFVDEEPKRHKAIFAHYGPVLAGGRLLVASNDGILRSFNPVSGAQVGAMVLPDGATSAPVIANRTLYLITQDGTLLAYR